LISHQLSNTVRDLDVDVPDLARGIFSGVFGVAGGLFFFLACFWGWLVLIVQGITLCVW
jgi:hypothetical protein